MPKNPNQTILRECGTCLWLSTSIHKETLKKSSTEVFLLEVETQYYCGNCHDMHVSYRLHNQHFLFQVLIIP